MYDVITIGSATIDVFAQAESELISIKTSHDEEELIAFPIGSKIIMNKLMFTVGGGGTNTAAALNRLGLKVAWIGKVGDDGNAHTVLEYLKKEKIDTGLIAQGSGNTGYSVILDSLKHDRAILACKGVNNELRAEEVRFERMKSKWIYSSSMMGESYKTLEKVFEFAGKAGIGTMFNPSSYQAKQGRSFLGPILSRTDILVLNREEAELLLDCPGKDVKGLLSSLRELGPNIAIITDGSEGVHVSDGRYRYSARPPKVKVVDSTGAGDAFGSSFLAGIIRKNDIEFSMRLGIANATSVLQHYSSKDKLLTWDEAMQTMKSQKVRVRKEAV